MERELDPGYVERAEVVVRRAMGLPEGTALRAERLVVGRRELVAQVALALEEAERRGKLVGAQLPAAVLGTGQSGPDLVPARMALGPGWRDGE